MGAVMKLKIKALLMKSSFCIISCLQLMSCKGQPDDEKTNTRSMDSNTPFQTLLNEANDFDLVNGTFVKIGDRYGHWVDAAEYTPEERVIMLVWHSSGIIDNGGFEYLFSGNFDGDPDFKMTAEAHREAGLPRSYEAFQEAFAIFSDSNVPHDSNERSREFKNSDESKREAINKKYWQDGWDELRQKKLAQFIREHVSELGDLDKVE